jgi:hypothetical protein
MSNFAATSSPISGRLSPVVEITSEIIDAFSNTNYVFLDVSVGFSIRFPLRFLGLEASASFDGFGTASGNMMMQSPYGMAEVFLTSLTGISTA